MSRPRFNAYREIVAQFAAPANATDCGHSVKVGERIGYTNGHIQCADCWRRWSAENDEAARAEAYGL